MTSIGYSDYLPNSQFQMHYLAFLGKILPNDKDFLMTICWPCPEVVIISHKHCINIKVKKYFFAKMLFLLGRLFTSLISSWCVSTTRVV